MQNTLKLSLLIVFSASCFFAFSPRASADLLPRENEETANAPAARKLYLKNCARCHGADGKSDTETGKLNDAPDLTETYVKNKSRKHAANVIANGADGMPAFGKKLTKAEIASLVGYIRVL
jgi:mono/diheme cytochrome c family protein